ncbi:MAG TPA: type II toxin-antitoxin system VapC family toxin [Zeimonas sp.]
MIGLDTNVLVRYLAQDDPVQSARATRLMERELSERARGFVSLPVLLETCWVLKRLYKATEAEILATVRDLLDARQVVVARRAVVSAALARLSDAGGDFADALIAECATEAGCERTVTFDRNALRLGMQLLR